MNRFKNIVFFADGSKGEKEALKKAMTLAQTNEATLTVLDIVAEVGTDDKDLLDAILKLQQGIIQERQVVVEALVKSVLPKKNPPQVVVKIVPGEKDFIQVIREVVRSRFDLLIKPIDQSGILSNAIFGDKDFHILRQCPCPIWLLKPGKQKSPAVLAALDLSSADPATNRFAEMILQISIGVAAMESAELHVLSAWKEPLDAKVKKLMRPDQLSDLQDRHKNSVRERFEKLMAKYPEAKTEHLVRGNASAAIQRHVKDYDISLLVMGTMSRTGVPGLLIGNTAEKVLSDVDCSLLTLKPKSFKSLIK